MGNNDRRNKMSIDIENLTNRQIRTLANNGYKHWLVDHGHTQWLVDHGYRHWLANNGYMQWLADNGYKQWLVDNGYTHRFKGSGNEAVVKLLAVKEQHNTI